MAPLTCTPAIGTKISNIYTGLVNFYQNATPVVPNIGMCYNKSPHTLTGQVPSALTSSAIAALQPDMLNIIKNENISVSPSLIYSLKIVSVFILGILFLNEKITTKKIISLMIILIGFFLLASDSNTQVK